MAASTAVSIHNCRDKCGDVSLRRRSASHFQDGFTIASALLAADTENVQHIVDVAYSRFKLGIAGVDARANLQTALDLLEGLQTANRLPGANKFWITMVEAALDQVKNK